MKAEPEVTQESNIKVVQFRYKNYVEVLPLKDLDGPKTATGNTQNVVIRARNWRCQFDLNDPKQKERFEALMKSKQKDVSFWVLGDIDKRKDKISGRAETLQKLLTMSEAQLSTMLSAEEMQQAGLIPGRATKMELIMATIDAKKLG